MLQVDRSYLLDTVVDLVKIDSVNPSLVPVALRVLVLTVIKEY